MRLVARALNLLKNKFKLQKLLSYQNQRRINHVYCFLPRMCRRDYVGGETEVGEIIVCSDCGVDLEVTALEPATVQLAPMEQEDWGE